LEGSLAAHAAFVLSLSKDAPRTHRWVEARCTLSAARARA
jgi:hypothetical protein